MPKARSLLILCCSCARLHLMQTLRNLLRPIVHCVLGIAPLERCRALQAHTAGALINCFCEWFSAE